MIYGGGTEPLGEAAASKGRARRRWAARVRGWPWAGGSRVVT